MEAAVDEVSGDVEEQRPGDGVGDDETDAVAAEELDEFGCGEGFVADFDAVTEALGGAGAGGALQADAAGEAGMVEAGEGFGFGEGAGQEVEEGGEFFRGEAHLRRELPEDGTDFVAELKEAAGEEVGERLLDVFELEHVGDEARAFDGEDEARWGLLRPGAVAGGPLHGVEAAVELDGGEVLGGELELAALRKFGRIEDAAPVAVTPAGDADADFAGLGQEGASLCTGLGRRAAFFTCEW